MGQYQGIGFQETTSIPDDLFILNPFRQRIVTGKRNYAYLWSRFGWAGVILTLFLIFIFAIGMPRFLNEMRLLIMKTASTEAQVIDHRISKGKSTTYNLTYEFRLNGHVYSREETVSSSEYNRWDIGRYLPVTYAVEDPNTSHVGGPGLHWGAIAFVPIFLIILLIFGGIWAMQSIPTYLKLKRLRRDGQLIFGQLKSSTGQLITRGSGKNKRKDYDVTIYCQFVNAIGKRIDAQATYTRNDLKKKELQTRGSIAVLYVSDDDYMVL